jgi:hypothetical protein
VRRCLDHLPQHNFPITERHRVGHGFLRLGSVRIGQHSKREAKGHKRSHDFAPGR